MYTEKDIYILFRKKQSEFLNRPYQIPKNWDEYFSNKMTTTNRAALTKLTDRFNTRWNSVNPGKYFEVGFDLFNKTFTYAKFFDERILSLYIQRDKNLKFEDNVNKSELLKSFKFIKKYIKEHNISSVKEYAQLQEKFQKQCVYDYKLGNLSKFVILYFVNKGYIQLTNEDLSFAPFLADDTYGAMKKMLSLKNFIEEMEKRI